MPAYLLDVWRELFVVFSLFFSSLLCSEKRSFTAEVSAAWSLPSTTGRPSSASMVSMQSLQIAVVGADTVESVKRACRKMCQ